MHRVLALTLMTAFGLMLAGCGGEGTTDPATLPPLTEQDLKEIADRDAEVEGEENALRTDGPPRTP